MLRTNSTQSHCLTQRHYVLLVMALLYGSLCFLQSSALAAPASKIPAPKITLPTWIADTAWTTEEWTGDSAPYRQKQQSIDRLITVGEKPSVLLSKYQKEAQQHPSDPQRQFAWAYAAYLIASARQTPHSVGYDLLEGPREALVHAPSPPVYEYDRLRFLVYGYGPELRYKLRELAKRLLQRVPNDAAVKTRLAYTLSASRDTAEQQQALAYAQELAKNDATSLARYMVPASIAFTHWRYSHDKADADKAIAAYQQWLQHASPDDAFRQEVTVTLNILSGKW